MMIEAVFIFAFASAVLEAILFMKITPRRRLRLLGNPLLVNLIHTVIGITNLAIHFGTAVGTMTAIVATLASFAVVPLVKWYSGYIKQNKYFPGIKRYSYQDLR